MLVTDGYSSLERTSFASYISILPFGRATIAQSCHEAAAGGVFRAAVATPQIVTGESLRVPNRKNTRKIEGKTSPADRRSKKLTVLGSGWSSAQPSGPWGSSWLCTIPSEDLYEGDDLGKGSPLVTLEIGGRRDAADALGTQKRVWLLNDKCS